MKIVYVIASVGVGDEKFKYQIAEYLVDSETPAVYNVKRVFKDDVFEKAERVKKSSFGVMETSQFEAAGRLIYSVYCKEEEKDEYVKKLKDHFMDILLKQQVDVQKAINAVNAMKLKGDKA